MKTYGLLLAQEARVVHWVGCVRRLALLAQLKSRQVRLQSAHAAQVSAGVQSVLQHACAQEGRAYEKQLHMHDQQSAVIHATMKK